MLCDVTLRMIEGELYQLTKNGDADITEDEHFDIIAAQDRVPVRRLRADRRHARQGVERAASRRCASTASTSAWRSSSSTTCSTSPATPQAVGKPIASDLREGKVTLPLIHLQQHGERRRRRRRSCATSSRRATRRRSSGTSCCACLKEHASIDYAYRRAVDFTERAKKPLYAFPPSSERDALLALPDYVLSRDR